MLKPLLCISTLARAILALQPETWEPISVGLMMQQRSLPNATCPNDSSTSGGEHPHSALMRRAHRQSRRDYKQTVESIQRMDTGGILLPGETIPSGVVGGADGANAANAANGVNGVNSANGEKEEKDGFNGSVNGNGGDIGKAKDYHAVAGASGGGAWGEGQGHRSMTLSQNETQSGGRQHGKREEGESFMSIITWYTGNDLLDPSCITEGTWSPTDESMIAAVTLNWPNKPPCGSFLELRKTKKDPPSPSPTPSPSPPGSNPPPPPPPKVDSIIVRVMDSCAGCKAGVPHVDLTKAGFRALYALDIGYVDSIEVKLLSKPPFEKWGKQEEMLYGPEKLNKSKSSSSSSSKGSPTKNDGPSWTSSRDDSWTSKNTAPAWTPDASPRVLGGGGGGGASSGGGTPQKEKSSKQSSAPEASSSPSSSGKDSNGKMNANVNGGSGSGSGKGEKGKKGSAEPEGTSPSSQSGPQSDEWKENGWKWGN